MVFLSNDIVEFFESISWVAFSIILPVFFLLIYAIVHSRFQQERIKTYQKFLLFFGVFLILAILGFGLFGALLESFIE